MFLYKILLWLIILILILFHFLYSNNYLQTKIPSFQIFNYFLLTTTQTTTESTTTLFLLTKPSTITIEIDDKIPSYKLVTLNGEKPLINQGRNEIIQIIDLYKKCQKDSSTIVLDVGAKLGDFGLYTLACQCHVYIFESDSSMISLINQSIEINFFPLSSIEIYQNIVTYLSLNENLKLKTNKIPIDITNIRLDDINYLNNIYLLNIHFDLDHFDILKSAEKLFSNKRISHLIFSYDSLENDEKTKKELFYYIGKILKPFLIYLFHSNEKILYGPLFPSHLFQLAKYQSRQKPIIGFYAIFQLNFNRKFIKSKRYIPKTFFN